MITMKTGSKSPVRFTFSDDVSETTITIAADDPSEVIAVKLQRVLELEGVRPASAVQGMAASAVPQALLADRAATEERLAQVQPQGWSKNVDIEQLPEM